MITVEIKAAESARDVQESLASGCRVIVAAEGKYSFHREIAVCRTWPEGDTTFFSEDGLGFNYGDPGYTWTIVKGRVL